MPGRGVKLTPLHRLTRDQGAQFVDQKDWSVPEVFGSREDEVAASREGVMLADETPNGKLLVEGTDGAAVLGRTFSLSELEIGSGALTEQVCVYRLRQDLFFIHTPPGAEQETRRQIRSGTKESFVTCTDITHGRTEIRVVGPASRDLLSKVCGLDFADGAFPNGAAWQSSVAKTTQLIIRRDIGKLPGFSLIGGRSSGAYLWEVLIEAGRDWETGPIGLAALVSLELETS